MVSEVCGRNAAFEYALSSDDVRWAGGPDGPVSAAYEALVRLPEVRRALDDCLSSGAPFSIFTQVRSECGTPARALVVGERRSDPSPVVRGHVVDVTREWRQEVSQGINVQVQAALATRPAIDQAKGILMYLYGMGADEAFTMLAKCSQQSNVKVHDVAKRLMRTVGPRSVADDLPVTLDDLMTVVQGEQEPGPRTAAVLRPAVNS